MLRKIFLSILVLAVLGFAGVAWEIARFGDNVYNGQADVAVVLGAAAWGNRPSPVYRERINQAIQLYREGKVRWIIFTGGTPEPGYPSEAEVGRKFSLERGIPAEAMLLDTESRSTWQNLEQAKLLMATAKLNTALLVSDPLHMRRAIAMATDIGMEAKPAPTTSSRFQTWQSWSAFLWRETWLYLAYAILHRPS
jgi:uncharacterized SAM-binding protein YcdF (DUF218 family)